MLELNRCPIIPEGFLTAEPEHLHTVLPGPTLLEIEGKIPEPLFVSVLLHGNEPTGLKAMQRLLQKYSDRVLPRSLAIFIGNIAAAQSGLRRLDGQPDYNRIWPGMEAAECDESLLARQVYESMQTRKVFASIDIHNNTGLNPHYACINRLDDEFIQLAALFGRLIVYFTRPKGVQSAAFAGLCPSVTLECGRPDQPLGIDHALDFVETCLHLKGFRHQPLHTQDIDLFHTVAQVKIPETTSFSFGNPEAALLLHKNIDRFNFNELPAGTVLGKVNGNGAFPVAALDDDGNDAARKFFRVQNGYLELARATMPSMLTLNEEVIRQDCLCYLMERLSQPTQDHSADLVKEA